MQVTAEKHFSLDKGINAEMMVLGITAQPLVVLVRAWPQLLSTSNHTYLFVKTLQTNSSCFQNNGDTSFLPWPHLSHIPATSRLYLQREWEAASKKVIKRKSVAGICCKNAFREGEILVLKNS